MYCICVFRYVLEYYIYMCVPVGMCTGTVSVYLGVYPGTEAAWWNGSPSSKDK